MHVLVSKVGAGGSVHYRVDEPARAVREADLGVTVTTTRGLSTTMVPVPGETRLHVGSVDTQGADVVVLQLPTTVEMLQCLRLLQEQDVAVVVEVDDLLSALPFGHPDHRAVISTGAARWIAACAREADLVIAPTPALMGEYAPHGRGAVVPNAIPRRVAELPPAYEQARDTVTIGWTGSVLGRPYDFLVLGSGLEQALDRTRGSSRFVVLGQAVGARERLALSRQPDEVPWCADVDAYTALLGRTLDVGIAPVREDRFNASKSGLKVLEYAARGVYPVYSPHPEYDRMRLGRRARNARDWARHLTAAVQDADQRREAAATNRERVLAEHLTEHTAERWVAAWRRARENRTRAMRVGA